MTMAQDVQRHNTLLYQQKQFFWIKMISAAIAGYGNRSRARLALVAVLRQCDGSAKSLATERPAGCRSRIRARPALVAMLRQEAVLILAIPPGGDTELRQISCVPPREIRRRADLPQAIFGRPRQLFAHTSTLRSVPVAHAVNSVAINAADFTLLIHCIWWPILFLSLWWTIARGLHGEIVR